MPNKLRGLVLFWQLFLFLRLTIKQKFRLLSWLCIKFAIKVNSATVLCTGTNKADFATVCHCQTASSTAI